MRNLIFSLLFLIPISAHAEPKTATDKIVDEFMALDSDASTSVSFEEYMAMVQQRAQERFANMDQNGDGNVTADEYRDFWSREKSDYYRLNR